MFNDPYLLQHLDVDKQTVTVETGCFAELNQNDLTNIETVGVFRLGDYPEWALKQWGVNPDTYVAHALLPTNIKTDADYVDFQYAAKHKKSDYFSLIDCFTEFRPRSGIVKMVQPFTTGQTFVDDFKSMKRPRYYAPTTKDAFKYWSSWDTDRGQYVGLSDGNGAISNAAPFVVYKQPIAANKICVKIQTGIGETVSTQRSNLSKGDPLSNPANSNIPRRWKIQYLDIHNTWQDAIEFRDYDPDVLDPASGIVDLSYMVKNPSDLDFPNFCFKGYVPTLAHLPYVGRYAEAFCVGRDQNNVGNIYIWTGTDWVDYGRIDFHWQLANYTINPEDYSVKTLVDPPYYNTSGGNDASDEYSEFVMMRGLRILVYEMLAPNKPFDLIELSPRLFINLSPYVMQYSVDKAIGPDDTTLPVGGLFVSNGTLVLSNMDLFLNREMAFNADTHKGSIISGRLRRNTKILFYEIIRNVDVGGVDYDKFVPVKNLYVVEKPLVVSGTEDISITLRDFNFRFEEIKCPRLVLKDCSLTKAVATTLDWAGFSNYIFHFGERYGYAADMSPMDSVIPYYFINDTISVAEALENLAIATQCAMFFDEYNNFVVMPREHFDDAPVYTLRGSDNLVNIESIESISSSVIADASIKFTHRDLARSTLPLQNPTAEQKLTRATGEASNVMAYKVAQLWTADNLSNHKTLSSGPLNTDLSAAVPVYDPSRPDTVANNTMDIGLYSEYFPFQGMVYMNGEVVRYDAKQYVISGRNMWVSSQEHLTELTARSSFTMPDGSGQMIFPTGLLRIYTELTKTSTGQVSVSKHGRGMFGTQITSHTADPVEWLASPVYVIKDQALDSLYGVGALNNTYEYGKQDFSSGENSSYTVLTNDAKATTYIYNSVHSRNSETALNPLSITPANVNQLNADRRIMKSSALSFGGPDTSDANHIYMKTKVLNGANYNLFGARIGIIGHSDFESDQATVVQSPIGTMQLGTYALDSETTAENASAVMGAGGGLAFMVNRNYTGDGRHTSNDGYYFEIMALNAEYLISSETGEESSMFANVNFYKINRAAVTSGDDEGAQYNVPVKLWSTYAPIKVTDGSQTARDRLIPSESSVYDLAVEVKQTGAANGIARTFHLYLNDALIGVVEELGGSTGYFPEWSPNNEHMEFGLFVRGSSQIQVEHLYAVGTSNLQPAPIFIDRNILSRPRAFRQFSPSGMFSTAAINGNGVANQTYFEEFGTLAREVRHIKAEFDMFPILLSKMSPRQVFDRAFSVSGYYSDPYGADFLLWSQADRLLDLTSAETSLSISGIPFEDSQEQTITLDDYLLGRYDGADKNAAYTSEITLRNTLLSLRASGQTEKIELASMYIQNRPYALKMLKWLAGFVGQDRTVITLKAFAVPHLQIGDIITLDYDIPYYIDGPLEASETDDLTDPDYVNDYLSFKDNGERFIIQSISIDRGEEGPDYTLKLVQLPTIESWKASDF